MKRRLYFQVYVGFLIAALLCGELMVVVFADPPWRAAPALPGLGGPWLPLTGALSAGATPEELQRELVALQERLAVDAAVWSADGTLLAAVGEVLPFPASERCAPQKDAGSGWLGLGPSQRLALVLPLPDGRCLVTEQSKSRPIDLQQAQIFLVLLLVSIAVGSYPLARRITRRLERLQRGVEELGSGDLASRVPVEGEDEVAQLARSFNRAAERIEGLVGANRRMLAGASHELRTPLTRLRLRLALLGDAADGEATGELDEGARRKLIEESETDIEELNELIDDLLLVGRLEARGRLDRVEPLDLLALVQEEAARFGVATRGASITIPGDPRALRRLVRNLLENARVHGQGVQVEACVEPLGAGARLLVVDRGPGVPDTERERIFEPFYRAVVQRPGADGGVGLGLALVRQVARQHGGDARCLPRRGSGARFEVDLPGAASAASGQLDGCPAG